RRNRCAPGELYAPSVGVSKRGSESRDQPTWLKHEFIESVAMCSNNPGPLQMMTWSPDGNALAVGLYESGNGNGDLYVIGANGHNKIRLTRSSDMDMDPSWAPR